MATAERSWLTLEGVPFDPTSFSRVWLLALATYGVGDIVTTIAIVWFSPFHVEGNPIVALSISLFGGGGFLALKLLVFYAAIALSLWGGLPDVDRTLFYAPPVCLFVVGLLTTGFNLTLLV